MRARVCSIYKRSLRQRELHGPVCRTRREFKAMHAAHVITSCSRDEVERLPKAHKGVRHSLQPPPWRPSQGFSQLSDVPLRDGHDTSIRASP